MDVKRRSAVRPAMGRGRLRSRRGTSLVELAMCIPLLAAVMALTSFLGWAMMKQQNVKASARYTAWRHVYGNWPGEHELGPNYVDTGEFSDVDAMSLVDDGNHPGLNLLFFRGEAVSVDVGVGTGPTDELEQLVGAAYDQSEYAGAFADRLILSPPPDYGHFQHARSASVSAAFRSDVNALNRFQGPIRSGHIRDGVEWRRNQATSRHVTRLQYLEALDDVLLNISAPGDGMGRMMRSVYRNGW